MGRKKDKNKVIANLTIEKYAAEGKCVTHFDSLGPNNTVTKKVLFVPFAAVGDVADIKILRSRTSFAEGTIERLITPSPVRVSPKCEQFGVCGGCKWQHIPYEEQLKFKQQQVMDALTRIGKVELPECTPIDGSRNIWNYRNKLEFTFADRRWLTYEEIAQGGDIAAAPALGFHVPNMFDKVLDINKCHLQPEPSNAIRDFIKAYCIENGYSFHNAREHQGLMRGIIIRTASTGEIMLSVIFNENDQPRITTLLDAVKERFPEITSLIYFVNEKWNDSLTDQTPICYAGKDHIFESMEGLKFKVGPKSFYQTNSEQAYELYKITREAAELKEGDTLYDLYTGTGTIANFCARQCKKVVGIEYVPEAIEDAKVNSAINGIDNTVFYAGDMKKVLDNDFIARNGRPDVIILDPPRAGVDEPVIDVILNAAPQRIVYVSCNPATQARDLALMSGMYRIVSVQPVDMFPHTHHVENVVKLEKR